MRWTRSLLHRLGGGLLLGALAVSSVWADQNSPRLDALFGQLHVARSSFEAGMLEQMIWEVWIEHEDPQVQRQMRSAADFMSAQEYGSALALLDTVVEQVPDYAEGWNRRATVRFLAADYKGSVEDIDRTLALEPRHFGALSGLGQIRMIQQRPEEALEAFERALEVNPHMRSVRTIRDRLKLGLQQQAI